MKNEITITGKNSRPAGEHGVALVTTLLIMSLLLGFVVLALSRISAESRAAYNDAAEAKTLAASEAGLEDATRDFATVLEHKLNPSDEDLERIRTSEVEGFTENFDFEKSLIPVGEAKLITIQSGAFQGLYSLRDEWQINVTAHESVSDVRVRTMRRFYNHRIPLFQFGAFYQDDLELNRPPLFTFSGKVHTNGNLFVSSFPLASGGGIFFKSKVTVAGEIVNDVWKTGTKLAAGTDDTGDVHFPNASGANQKLTVGNGSVTCTNGTGGILEEIGGRGRVFPYPNCTKNSNWASFSQRFEGNLTANTKELRLPLDRLDLPLIEIMRRGKNVGDKANSGGIITNVTSMSQDNLTVSQERYANKQGIRISLADAKNKLPGCADVTGQCGVRLDGQMNADGTLGYQPLPMTDNATYKTTSVNGSRLAVSGREVWIKVETVDYDFDAGEPITADITEDFLSLGMTEAIPSGNFRLGNYASGQDNRSIIKIQHFSIPGTTIPDPGATSYLTTLSDGSTNHNFVGRFKLSTSVAVLPTDSECYGYALSNKATCTAADAFGAPFRKNGAGIVTSIEKQHYKLLCLSNVANCAIEDDLERYLVVPFPIQMYDSREGNRADSGSGVTAGYVYRNGVMSLIDIDVANLREFFKGTWDDKFPTATPYAVSRGGIGLKNTDIPDNRGWVVYFSDRRGDSDFDGRYTMEDVNPNSNSTVDEDLDNNGTVEADYTNEAPAQSSTVESGLAAVTDHAFYRRGVRLINARDLPGKYDSAAPANTKGFTAASENGIYVGGNFNVQSVTLPGGTAPADSTAYLPQNTTAHIPSSIVGDSVTLLSNSWNDASSFANAFSVTSRVASNTQVRFAMIAGDSLTARTASGTNGDFDGLNGGLHNFMRFLESWSAKRLNYSGSLINLYNSFNNNGKWKCCVTVYNPPTRDWTFDSTFSDPNRLPPGSPYVYYLSFTGFQRVSE